jgi:DNA-binding CsgD family transcriptional regulator
MILISVGTLTSVNPPNGVGLLPMRDLRSADYTTALDFVGALLSLQTPGERVAFTARALGCLVASDVRSINFIDLEHQSVVAVDDPIRTCTPQHRETLMRLAGRGPVVTRFARSRDRTLSLRYELVSVVPTSASRWTCVALDRVRWPDFTERDEAMLSLVMPSIAHACKPVENNARMLEAGRELTAREHDVLRLVCSGATNREIGLTLAISQRTVQAHLAHIFDKLGVHTRTAAAGIFQERARTPTA